MTTGERTRIIRVVGACLAVSALLVACGDDDDDAASVTSVRCRWPPRPARPRASLPRRPPRPMTQSRRRPMRTTHCDDRREAAARRHGRSRRCDGDECRSRRDAAATTAARREHRAAPASSAPESSAPASEVCAARDDLSDSVAALGAVSISNVTSERLSAISDAIGDVREDLGAVGSAAGAELRSQVQDVEDAIGELETAVDAVSDGGGVRPPLRRLGNVVSTAGTLLTSLGTRCPTSTSVAGFRADDDRLNQRRRLPAATMAANSSSVNGNTDSRLPLASRRELASSGMRPQLVEGHEAQLPHRCHGDDVPARIVGLRTPGRSTSPSGRTASGRARPP